MDDKITPEIVKRLRIKSDMINMGEKIAWGSETALMDEAATLIEQQSKELAQLRADMDRQLAISSELATENEKIRAVKDGAYSERNKLVAALSKLFSAWLERHPDSDTTWEDDWRWIVFIQLPTGQASWHIHDSELRQFNHLERKDGNSWDGHTTDEKYSRLNLFSPITLIEDAYREGYEDGAFEFGAQSKTQMWRIDRDWDESQIKHLIKSKLTDAAQPKQPAEAKE